ncbi:hypothetical protein WJ0W_005707 [Paenibacillus melissococcoides]|uniref:Uncharacterized protein n=1 Tax=Paenibacillus melissococcoides TaxID=2912268 RepID=A0ABM9G9U3_9BACL|nr:hypothetical protein WJ0W_005707 [Paenibacillus melissococcoides]
MGARADPRPAPQDMERNSDIWQGHTPCGFSSAESSAKDWSLAIKGGGPGAGPKRLTRLWERS